MLVRCNHYLDQLDKMKGYTLIELVIVITLLAVVLLGGTSIFYKNLRSSGLGNVDLSVSSELRGIMSVLEKTLRFSVISGIRSGDTSYTRTDCLKTGSVTGDTLTIIDLGGFESVYSLNIEKIASTSTATAQKAYLTSGNSKVRSLAFTWYCESGVSDKIKIDIEMASSVLGSDFEISRKISNEINLLNSGIN